MSCDWLTPVVVANLYSVEITHLNWDFRFFYWKELHFFEDDEIQWLHIYRIIFWQHFRQNQMYNKVKFWGSLVFTCFTSVFLYVQSLPLMSKGRLFSLPAFTFSHLMVSHGTPVSHRGEAQLMVAKKRSMKSHTHTQKKSRRYRLICNTRLPSEHATVVVVFVCMSETLTETAVKLS